MRLRNTTLNANMVKTKTAKEVHIMNITDTCREMAELLSFDCEIIAAGTNVGEVYRLFNRAAVDAFDSGWAFRPVLLVVSEPLLETLYMNLNDDEEEIDRERIAQYNKVMLNTELIDGERLFADKLEQKREQVSAFMGKKVKPRTYGMDSFVTVCEGDSEETKELILAKVPTKNPWEIFAYLPFGGWNECPDTVELMSVSKYWHEKHGAIPSVISSDTLEYNTPKLENKDDSLKLATEMYLFCPDIIEQGMGTIHKLAAHITSSTPWLFWWD